MNRIRPSHLVRQLARRGTARPFSAWLNQARSDADKSLSSKVDVEKLFIDPSVQSLMRDLTGLDLERKIFKERRTSSYQRSHFALMTDERLEQTMTRMREEATHFLNFVPLKEPRSDEVSILAQDAQIANFDSSRFVFTDITFDATDQDRTVVVREVDGTLRTATVEEHDRMNRTYYPKENRPVFPPKVFENPWLQNALDREEHEFVLDWACYFYEPDDAAFVKLSRTIFDSVIASGNYAVLQSTRHFGPFVFYLALNGNTPPLLNHFGGQGQIRQCAKLIRLQKSLHPDWRVAIGSEDSDEKIVNDFIKQNQRFNSQLGDLRRFLADGTLKVDYSQTMKKRREEANKMDERKQARVSQKNVGTMEGPLGELSAEYSVKVATGDAEELLQADVGEKKPLEEKKKNTQNKPFRNQKPKGGSK